MIVSHGMASMAWADHDCNGMRDICVLQCIRITSFTHSESLVGDKVNYC